MAGKYAHVIHKLPRLVGVDDQGYQDKINAVKDEIAKGGSGQPLDDQFYTAIEQFDNEVRALSRYFLDFASTTTTSRLAAGYAKLRGIKGKFEEWESSVNLLIAAYEQLFLDAARNENVTTVKLVTGQSISYSVEPQAKVLDPAQLLAWVEANPDLRRSLALPWMTLNALCKERLLLGEDAPPGVEVRARDKMRFGNS